MDNFTIITTPVGDMAVTSYTPEQITVRFGDLATDTPGETANIVVNRIAYNGWATLVWINDAWRYRHGSVHRADDPWNGKVTDAARQAIHRAYMEVPDALTDPDKALWALHNATTAVRRARAAESQAFADANAASQARADAEHAKSHAVDVAWDIGVDPEAIRAIAVDKPTSAATITRKPRGVRS